MSIRLDCVGCNKSLVVHDRFEGRVVRCPACGFEIVVPKKTKLGDEKRIPRVEPVVDEKNPSSKREDKKAKTLQSPKSNVGEVNDDAEKENSIALQKERQPRSIRKEHDKGGKELEWDITPMVDVAFLLLIFFMLTASFSIQKVIRTAPPQSDQPSKNAVPIQFDERIEKISVQIDEFNAYTVVFGDGQTSDASSKQELTRILRDFRILVGDPLPRIVIQSHVDSFHGTTVGCMDAAREAGFSDFQLFGVESFD